MTFPDALTLPVAAPYRLDLTVAILRRLEAQGVDRFTDDGRYLRALGSEGGPVIDVAQSAPNALRLRVHGEASPADLAPLVRRVLGLDVGVRAFARRAASIEWLKPTVRLMRGVRPPTYPSLFEACVNAIVFQQVSIVSASAMLRRAIAVLSAPQGFEGLTLYPFPPARAALDAPEATLLGAGLSRAKVTAVKAAARAILDGELNASELERLESPALSERLQHVKGIGPWTAAIILLRGFGRLDVFPMNDSGAAQSLRLIAPDVDAKAVERALETLGDVRGMLYYSLLVGRLAAKGSLQRAAGYEEQIGRASSHRP